MKCLKHMDDGYVYIAIAIAGYVLLTYSYIASYTL